MDFAELDLKAASERGSWVSLMYGGKPTDGELLIRGMGAPGVLDAFRRVERVQELRAMQLQRSKEDAQDAVLSRFQGELEGAMGKLIVASVAEWKGIIWGGEELSCTPENVLKLCGPGTLFFGQISDAIKDQHRLFTKPDSAS